MRVKCRRIISATTGEDMSDEGPDPCFTIGKEYLVVGIKCTAKFGLEIDLITDSYNTLTVITPHGFEFTSHYIPSFWVSNISMYYNLQVMRLIPNAWTGETFFNDLHDDIPEAMEIFRREVDRMCDEEEEHTGVRIVINW